MLIRLICLTLLYLSIAVPAFSLGHYRDLVQDTKGNAMGNVSVAVYTAGSDVLATIYSDVDATVKTNPFLTDATGSYDFYATSGVYDIVLSCSTCYGGRSYTFDVERNQNVYILDSISVSVAGLDDNFDVQPQIFNATLANPMIVGNGTQGVKIGGDATIGGFIQPNPLGDSPWRCWTNFNCIIRDEEAGATVLTIDPDAASSNAMYQFGTNYKPLMSFPVPLEPRGAATSASASLTTNVPKRWYLTLTDANTDAADFSFPVTARMAGATTMTFRLIGVSANATPSGNIDLDCAAYTYTPGTDTIAAHSTTGEVTVLLTPATQYRPVATTSSAHTINGGALVAGDIVFGSCEVDATATTSAQMTDFRLFGEVVVTLSANSWSD